MYVSSISRLTSTTSKQLIKRTLTKNVSNLFRQETNRGTLFLRTASTSNNQENSNGPKKDNMTNVIYVVGALTGLGAIYSIVSRSKRKQFDRIV